MAIKCGRGHYHESVAEVRACYEVPANILTRDFRPNKFPGQCAKCGWLVEAQAGRVDKNPTTSKWEVSHLDGKCIDQGRPATGKTEAPPLQGTAQYDVIPRGHYATKSLTGNNDFDFWRIDRPEQGAHAGRTFVKRIVGGKPDMNVSRATKFAALDAILEEGIEATAFRYGQELGRCSSCNRHLTDETSRALSKGPECRSKGK